jgi:uncharacterized protein (TIGR00730 family)
MNVISNQLILIVGRVDMNWIIESFRLLFANLRGGIDFVRGLYWLSHLESPVITIFAGHYAGIDESYLRDAHNVGYQCVLHDYSVLSGGGPGVMQAANCGALEASKAKKEKALRTFGIGVRNVDVGFVNNCAKLVRVDTFYVRRWLLTRYSVAFVVFPGGIGTADELFDILNSLKLHRVPNLPVILFGRDYWTPLVDWMKEAVEQGFIKREHHELIHLTDDPQEVIRIVNDSRNKTPIAEK